MQMKAMFLLFTSLKRIKSFLQDSLFSRRFSKLKKCSKYFTNIIKTKVDLFLDDVAILGFRKKARSIAFIRVSVFPHVLMCPALIQLCKQYVSLQLFYTQLF